MPHVHDNHHESETASSTELAGLPSYITEVPQARPHIHETRKFPDGFLWGTATSAHQVEGGNTNNDWYRWEQQGRVLDKQISGDACDHYCRYEQDFDLAAELGNNAHRLSLEWSRIEPQPGEFDLDQVLHYRRVLEALKKRGLKTMVTLWHFTLPLWVADRGGWSSRQTAQYFVRYTEFVARELGDLVDIWITINEPMIYLTQTYGTGAWPPGQKNIWRFLLAFKQLARAHKNAYQQLHSILDTKTNRIQVGIAKNVVTYEPYRRYSEIDSLFIRLMDRLFNHQFFKWTKRHHDFIGINYYFHYRIKYRPTKAAQFFFEVHTENREVSDLGWEIYPPGIFDALLDFTRYGLPIYITENGLASADDGKRPRFLVSMVKEIYHAIKAGADVRGYFHWSLLDNFEWEKGFGGRFGLIAVDFQTQQRTPRRSYYVYQNICQENGLPHDLLKFAGHGVRW
ncbi:glycoside hydrolase family 1 protein [Patescibacteria group bacterium]|nr:glycoside hydrolase family 1 protein [Patescibacteria group bacterium]MBU1915936.1 glycoside hydrolase family 1 protein [Patescibacteria group bacterium]